MTTGPGDRSSEWLMRTYSGHSTPLKSNALYRANLSKGQTGLSVAFDLPTQTGYDPDEPRAAGEVGKVGVPVAHLGHLRELMAGIPLDEMNTSMTINATAAWLLGLYVAHATEVGIDPVRLSGTTQNDIVKEYLSRGTFIFPPDPSLRLTVDTIAYTLRHVPRWNPVNVCSYHLQEAGATPVQEIAYALATAIGILDAVRASGKIDEPELPTVVGRISFFLSSGVRFVEELCKVRAFGALWDRICAERYGVADARLRRFRYGVQVSSLGLTEQQPENNVTRIVLETLGVTLSADARARAIQLPAWNEALGLPRPWDQQWSLRIQQVLAYESDLLEHGDLFAGSKVVEALTSALVSEAHAELTDVLSLGGAFGAIEELKTRLVASQARRVTSIESGEKLVVGVNCFTDTEPSPLTGAGGAAGAGAVLRVDPDVEREMVEDVRRWRGERDHAAVVRALDALRRAASTETENVMEPTLALAHAGGTTGDWAGALREIFGEYRAPTGVPAASLHRVRAAAHDERHESGTPGHGRTLLAGARPAVGSSPPRLLVGKPGLDGHSNGAEQIALAARDAGFEVIYQGIRLTIPQIVAAARDEDVDVVGLSILSGSHMEIVPQVIAALRGEGVGAPVVVGGIIPPQDEARLRAEGVAAVYTPKDFEIGRVVAELRQLARRYRAERDRGDDAGGAGGAGEGGGAVERGGEGGGVTRGGAGVESSGVGGGPQTIGDSTASR